MKPFRRNLWTSRSRISIWSRDLWGNFCKGCYFRKSVGQCGSGGSRVFGPQRIPINFARPFIYSTAPAPAHVSALLSTLHYLPSQNEARKKLQENIAFFRENVKSDAWGESKTAIQTYFVTGNEAVRAKATQASEYAIKPIVFPTVAKGKERIRITLSAKHTKEQIQSLIKTLEWNSLSSPE